MPKVGYIVVTVQFEKEEGQVTARCLELGTATFGSTIEEAEENLKEAIELHLSTLEEVGEINRFFREHGIESYPEYPASAWKTLTAPPGVFVKAHIQRLEPAGAH